MNHLSNFREEEETDQRVTGIAFYRYEIRIPLEKEMHFLFWSHHVSIRMELLNIIWKGHHRPDQFLLYGSQTVCLCLLHSLETPLGVLHPVLGCLVEERDGPVRVGAKEGHENDQKPGTRLL